MLWLVAKVIFNQYPIMFTSLFVLCLDCILVWGHYPGTSRKLQPLKVIKYNLIVITCNLSFSYIHPTVTRFTVFPPCYMNW